MLLKRQAGARAAVVEVAVMEDTAEPEGTAVGMAGQARLEGWEERADRGRRAGQVGPEERAEPEEPAREEPSTIAGA